jgi:peptidyl-dipeptidase Dcp
MMCACTHQTTQNPFFQPFATQYGEADFSKIRTADYEPAFLKGIEQQNAEIQAIIDNPEAPTFENTILALDRSGEILNRVSGVFYALTEADTNDELTALDEKMAPILSEHTDNIYLNEALFQRVQAIHQQEADSTLTLTSEQHRLLDSYYKSFVRSGAALPADKQAQLREINKQLSTLGIAFSNHTLNEMNAFQLVIDNEADLAGIPEGIREIAAEEAKTAGLEGKWLFTLQASSRIPFLQYAENRALRQRMYEAYTSMGNHGDANDNKQVLKQIIGLRMQKAQLLGFANYADFALDENMAKTSQKALDFLHGLWPYALQNAKQERAEMQQIMDLEGRGEKLAAWDWDYYAEKLRAAKYDLSEDEIKPYFSLTDVQSGLFEVVKRLYGVTLAQDSTISVYNPDVKAYTVHDADGTYLGLFYADYFPRASKRSGAWMGNFREQAADERPFIYNVASLTKPTANRPSLLTIDEVQTVFHEFGHALHGLLTQCQYRGTSGTNVAQDFVELPSQIMEHWATEPEVLKLYAKHYQTREVMPDALIQKIQRQSSFNQGFMTTELLAASLLDMELHCLTDTTGLDVMDFEKQVMDRLGLIPEIAPRYRATYFNHIIGGYAAGYYSYLWAEVLDTDAFEAFKQHGIFDPATARAFRQNILERGNSDDPMQLYQSFRGAEPSLEPLLKARGLK